MVALGVVSFFVLLALLAGAIAPYDPVATGWSAVRKAPSTAHWFGTDEIGRDVLARVIWGARASLLAAAASVSIWPACAVPTGLTPRYLGGCADAVTSYRAHQRAAADRRGDTRGRRGDHRRSRAVFPRPGAAAARAVVGQHAQHREELHRQRALDGDLARPVDLFAGAFLQPARRR